MDSRKPDYQPFTLFALYTLRALITRKPCVAFETAFETAVFTMRIILCCCCFSLFLTNSLTIIMAHIFIIFVPMLVWRLKCEKQKCPE